MFSGGAAGDPIKFADLVRQFENSSQEASENFVFDTRIMKSIPELAKDFVVPHPFQRWDNSDLEKSGKAWRILSLGASRAGKYL